MIDVVHHRKFAQSMLVMDLVYVMDYRSNSTWGYYWGLTFALLVTGRQRK
jgi:hypothetical protein